MGMEPNDFKAWMERNDLRTEDVAAATGLNRNTIYRFLSGEEKLHKSTLVALENFRKAHEPKEDKAS